MSAVEAVGWLGNACFFSRFLVQWLASERAGRPAAPRSFWWMSLAGAAALGTYSVAVGEPVLLAGLLINAAIYARNLSLGRGSGEPPSTLALTLAAVAAAALLAAAELAEPHAIWTRAPFWFVVSVVGEAAWSSRFVVQWWLSERRRESHFPRAFWWLSLAGNTLLLAYALHLADAVYIASYCVGPLVQVRNLMLEGRARRSHRAHGAGAAAQGSGRNAGGVPE